MPPVARKKKKKKAETIAAQQLVVLAPVPFRLSLLEAPWRKRAHRAARLRVTPHPARSAPCTSKMTRRLLQLLPAADPVHVRRLRKLLRRRKLDNPLHQRARFHQWTKRLADSLHSATSSVALANMSAILTMAIELQTEACASKTTASSLRV